MFSYSSFFLTAQLTQQLTFKIFRDAVKSKRRQLSHKFKQIKKISAVYYVLVWFNSENKERDLGP